MKSRESKLILIIVILVILLIGMSINLILNPKGILTNTKQIIKEMTVSEYDSQITELNKSHTEYVTQVQENKKKLAQAISNENVATSEDATVDEMVTNIGKILETRTNDATATAEDIAKGKTAYVNGELITGNSNKTYIKYVDLEFLNIGGNGKTQDISVDLTDIPDYDKITLDNISTVTIIGGFADSSGNVTSIRISLNSYSNGTLIVRGTSFWSTYGNYAINVPIVITF